jgi:hypothetical protein
MRKALLAALATAFLARPAQGCCQLGGSACGDPFAIDCNNGVVCFVPWRTCPSCTCTTMSSGKTCLANASEPGSVPSLRIGKGGPTGGDLQLDWDVSCAGLGPDYSIHEGLLGVWYSHAAVRCTSAGMLQATLTPADGSRYYLIAPVRDGFTGSLGKSSTGSERPDGDPSCTDSRALAPCP